MEEKDKALDIITKYVESSVNEVVELINAAFENEFDVPSRVVSRYNSLFKFMLRHIIGNVKNEYSKAEWGDVLNEIVVRSQSLYSAIEFVQKLRSNEYSTGYILSNIEDQSLIKLNAWGDRSMDYHQNLVYGDSVPDGYIISDKEMVMGIQHEFELLTSKMAKIKELSYIQLSNGEQIIIELK